MTPCYALFLRVPPLKFEEPPHKGSTPNAIVEAIRGESRLE